MNRLCRYALTLSLSTIAAGAGAAREPASAVGPVTHQTAIVNGTHSVPGPTLATDAIGAAGKRLLDPHSANWIDAAIFLAGDPKGRGVLEEIIIHFRVTDNIRWTDAFMVYATRVRPRDVADRMLPEYLADLSLQQDGPGVVVALNRIAEFGVRGQSALPMLQWVQSFSRDVQQVDAATEAIRRVKGGRPVRLTGC